MELRVTCTLCRGDGTSWANSICPACDGEGEISSTIDLGTTQDQLDALQDKCDDIMNKCNDIYEYLTST